MHEVGGNMYQNPFTDRYLVIAEKPSVARTIAQVLVCDERKDGYLEGPDCVVSWCFGHLAEYAMPESYDEKYRKWSLEALPIIPEKWKLEVSRDKASQFKVLKDLLNRKEFSYVVNACDAGREGELIFNRVYELSGSRMPVRRLWISSMEDAAIREGFRTLKGADEYRKLANASVCRAQADWLVGMNASRAFTKVYDYRLSVGRVQTPTLAMLVDREAAITGFQKEQYFITHLLVESQGRAIDAISEHFASNEDASRLADMCEGRSALVTSLDRQTKTAAVPKLYDLTTLQRDANRLFGYTAAKTLECAQALYENKLITYPRTDSNYLTDDMEQTAKTVIAVIKEVFPFLDTDSADETGRLLNSKKVSDHHAIIPTIEIQKSDLTSCAAEEMNVLILIAARMICAAGKRHVYETVRANLQCCDYTFTAVGKSVTIPGWKAVEEAMKKHCRTENDKEEDGDAAGEGQALSSLYQGAQFSLAHTKVSEHWTQPPKHFTEDTLLASMERAGNSEMEADVERKGLGTPATRASTIDKLIQSGYATRRKRQVIATDAGKQLIAVLPEYLKSAKMTADWENKLLMIERGQYDSRTFMEGITGMLRRMLEECLQIDDEERKRFGTHKDRESLGICPICGSPVYEGKQNFYCESRECRFVLWKENRYLEKMNKKLDARMAKDLLANGKTRVRDLYSAKKDKLFTADLLMEWKDGRAMFSLDFPKQSGGRKKGAQSK